MINSYHKFIQPFYNELFVEIISVDTEIIHAKTT